MAARPMQLANARPLMHPALRSRNIMQPVRASKSPTPEELDILIPVTKREMMAAAATAAVAASPLAALAADEPTSREAICAANPTADACRTKPNPLTQKR